MVSLLRTRGYFVRLLVGVVLSVIGIAPAPATLYGVRTIDSGPAAGDSQLLLIEPSTGSFTYGAILPVTGMFDMAFSPNGVLYGIRSIDAGSFRLFTINTATGAIADGPIVGSDLVAGTLTNVRSIAFSPAGDLYAVKSLDAPIGSDNSVAFKINTASGVISDSSFLLPANIVSTAFSPGGDLYGTRPVDSGPFLGQTGLFKIDLANGLPFDGTFVALTNMRGISFSSTGVLYGIRAIDSGPFAGFSGLVTIDPLTGISDFPGGLPVSTTNIFDIAFSPTLVPEPEIYAMMLSGIGLLGFVARRRQGKKKRRSTSPNIAGFWLRLHPSQFNARSTAVPA